MWSIHGDPDGSTCHPDISGYRLFSSTRCWLSLTLNFTNFTKTSPRLFWNSLHLVGGVKYVLCSIPIWTYDPQATMICFRGIQSHMVWAIEIEVNQRMIRIVWMFRLFSPSNGSISLSLYVSLRILQVLAKSLFQNCLIGFFLQQCLSKVSRAGIWQQRFTRVSSNIYTYIYP